MVTAACQTSELTEIIIVDDGSSDATAAEARQAAAGDPRLRVLKHPTNRGKGEAGGFHGLLLRGIWLGCFSG